MATTLLDILKTARPRQWVKNLTLYAALIFTGNVLSPALWTQDFWKVTEAVASFTVIAASIYFFNDLIDIKNDQVHPFKRKRPIAAGRITRSMAITIFIIGSLVGLLWAKSLSNLYFLITLGY